MAKRLWIEVLGVALLVSACASGARAVDTQRPATYPGPPVWVPDHPFGGVWIDPFSGYPARGGMVR